MAITRERITAPILIGGTLQSRCELRKAPLRSAQIGRTHGGKQASIELLGRKSDGHANDCAADGVLAEDFPEGLALAAHFHNRPRKGDAVSSDAQNAPRWTDLGGRQLRRVTFQAAI